MSGHILGALKANRALNSSGTILFILTGVRNPFRPTITAKGKMAIYLSSSCLFISTLRRKNETD